MSPWRRVPCVSTVLGAAHASPGAPCHLFGGLGMRMPRPLAFT